MQPQEYNDINKVIESLNDLIAAAERYQNHLLKLQRIKKSVMDSEEIAERSNILSVRIEEATHLDKTLWGHLDGTL